MIVSPRFNNAICFLSMRHRVLLLFAMAAIGGSNGFAQTNVLDSDPLGPRRLLVYDQYGVFGGLSNNQQGGTFLTDCNCSFGSGARTGLTAGIMFERLTRSRITWGATLAYEDRSIDARYQEVEGVVQRAPSSGREYTVPITFRHTGEVSLSYLTLTPFAKYHLFEWLYLRGGPAISYIMSSNIRHTKELISDSVIFPTGEVASVALPGAGGRSVVLEDHAMPELNSLQISISAAVGTEFRVGKKVFLSPLVQYVFPLTTVTARGDGFSVRALQFLVEARVIM